MLSTQALVGCCWLHPYRSYDGGIVENWLISLDYCSVFVTDQWTAMITSFVSCLSFKNGCLCVVGVDCICCRACILKWFPSIESQGF